jgi:DNA-binding transcriptional LysR family regulator
VSLDIKDIRDIAGWVAEGPFDIGVTALPFEDARVECEPLATVPTVLVLPARHPLAAKRVVHARDLRGESMILPLGNPPRAQVCAPLEAAGLKIESMIDAHRRCWSASWSRKGSESPCSIPSPSN